MDKEITKEMLDIDARMFHYLLTKYFPDESKIEVNVRREHNYGCETLYCFNQKPQDSSEISVEIGKHVRFVIPWKKYQYSIIISNELPEIDYAMHLLKLQETEEILKTPEDAISLSFYKGEPINKKEEPKICKHSEPQ